MTPCVVFIPSNASWWHIASCIKVTGFNENYSSFVYIRRGELLFTFWSKDRTQCLLVTFRMCLKEVPKKCNHAESTIRSHIFLPSLNIKYFAWRNCILNIPVKRFLSPAQCHVSFSWMTKCFSYHDYCYFSKNEKQKSSVFISKSL